jgi:L-lactate utilization protein LutB
MSMTENEAIKQLQVGYLGDTEELVQAKHIAIKALEEVQAYKNGDCMNECEHYDNCANYIYSKGYNKAIDEFLKKICEKYTEEESKGNYKQYCCNIKQELADIAEQMKGGE